MAGRAVLTQYVLVQLVVYWAHLYYIPVSIIHLLNKITPNFIWGGNQEKGKYHLSKLFDISLPKKQGEWGILDLRTFGKVLLCKSLWRGIFVDSSWSKTIKKKYMASRDISYWYGKGKIGSPLASTIWMSFCKIEPTFLKNLVWSLQTGKNIFIGLDPIMGWGDNINISHQLMDFFHRKGYFT